MLFYIFAIAQTKKVYISKQGGKSQFFYAGKMAYSDYRLVLNDLPLEDSLVCLGAGIEKPVFDKKMLPNISEEKAAYFNLVNTAIKKVDKHIKKTKTTEGDVSLFIKNQKVIVKYKNADFKGNSDMHIELY
jgi:hypothetical protein